ncbi:nucleosome binding protein, partial [Lepidopterella palustris CBS 459.81]
MPLPFLTGELPEGPNRKRKREHDPNAPKRSKSAFIIFSNEQRDKVREENPGITFGEIGALLGKRWREMPADERAIWEAKSTADSKRYAEEKAAYKVARAESPVGE